MLKILLLLISSFIINNSVLKNSILKIPSHTTSFLFIILSIPIVTFHHNWSIIISLFLVTLIYSEIIGLYNNHMIKLRVLKTGLITGLIIVLNNYFIPLYILIIISLIYYKRFNLQYFLIQLLGFIYPFLFLYSGIFLEYVDSSKYKLFHLIQPNYSDITQYKLFIIVVFGLFIISIKELYFNFYKKKEIAKKGFYILLLILFISILYAMCFQRIDYLYFLIIPFSIIISNYLIYLNSTKFRTFLLGLLLISFIINFIYL